jgi:hypothetical protein
MITGAIPNPTKTIQVNYPNKQVQDAVDNLLETMKQYRMDGYIFHTKDEVLNTYIFRKGEILSFGVEIHINLNPVGEQTAVNVEVQRVIGAFDRPHEIGLANQYLKEVFQAISFALSPPSQEVQNQMIQSNEAKNQSEGNILLFVFAVTIFIFIATCS